MGAIVNSKRWLDLILLVLLLLSVALMALGHEDPFARDWLCARIRFCPTSAHAIGWNKTFYDIGIGGLLSLMFYGLLVRLPEMQRRQRIKRSFEAQYRSFKRDCISTILSVADGSYSYDLVDRLTDQEKFRAYFKEEVSTSQDRWDRFQNNLDEGNLRELLTTMEIFRDEVRFVLNNTNIPRDRPFEFFKRLSNAIYSKKDTTVGYDSTERFGNFLWDIFAGFSVVSGPRDTDMVQEMIRSI
jgi:hypothetical protein